MRVAENWLNRLVRLDPDAHARLAPLAGRSLAVKVTDLPIALVVVFTADGLRLQATGDEPAHASLQGPALALLGLAADARSGAGMQTGRVTVRGDMELVGEVAEWLGALDIDWEEQLAGYVGDPAARAAGVAAEGLGRWGSHVRATLGLDLEEYLRDEVALVPAAEEVVAFCAAVDVVRDDVERLASRVARLAADLGEAG